MIISGPLLLLASASGALAHSHIRSEQELAFHQASKRSLSHCQSSIRKRGLSSAATDRRAKLAHEVRAANGWSHAPLRKRDFEAALNKNHESNITNVDSQWVKPEVLFDTNTTCTLVPETTQGPYYTEGDFVRFDITESQDGVPVWMDLELIDVNTCEPVDPDLFVGIWSANATGVYSDVSSGGQFQTESSNLNTTFLRGVQPTQQGGYVQFKTLFPGHYQGRATHIHMIVHTNGTYQTNGTYTGSYNSHVGQLFFDQDLISEVEQLEPYSSNTAELTQNADDDILETESDGFDPMMEYLLVGDSLSDGLLAFASIGIDASLSTYTSPAAYHWKEGGVENADSEMGGGGMPPGGMASGGMPSGGMPSDGSMSPQATSSSS